MSYVFSHICHLSRVSCIQKTSPRRGAGQITTALILAFGLNGTAQALTLSFYPGLPSEDYLVTPFLDYPAFPEMSLSIEEIGFASGELGTSAWDSGGGYVDLGGSRAYFVSAGSTDGALIMNKAQGNGEFTLGGLCNGNTMLLNTRDGAPTGWIDSDGAMRLIIPLVAEFPSQGWAYSLVGFENEINTTTLPIDSMHYYYTADWTGSTSRVHMEGIATLTAVPEANTGAMLLTGLGLVTVAAMRRSHV